ncbi:hypothetical protein NPIL_163641 [Nephila pilipes]|uniref:Uncharacterized protein n=1 Tax=Nephila pilipes TaxID=299642 RepID=A0A8X6MSB0_NEPPI|nr:hypothetical protein NPIL_163641 [Nephila pilipes]
MEHMYVAFHIHCHTRPAMFYIIGRTHGQFYHISEHVLLVEPLPLAYYAGHGHHVNTHTHYCLMATGIAVLAGLYVRVTQIRTYLMLYHIGWGCMLLL